MSIHKCFNLMKNSYLNVKNKMERLEYMMNNHLSSTNPNARVIRVKKKKRNLKKNMCTE